jgi:biotin carboxyl carrier protein
VSATARLRLGERVIEVTAQQDGALLRASIDGRPLEAERLSPAMPPYAVAGAIVHEVAFVADGRTHRAFVAKTRERTVVTLNGVTYGFAAGDEAAAHGGAAGGTGRIVAPMPGKVIAVLVAVGDRVEHGQGVLIIEAMKMETTLPADVDGEVTRIVAAVGDSVDGGVVLVEIAPA